MPPQVGTNTLLNEKRAARPRYHCGFEDAIEIRAPSPSQALPTLFFDRTEPLVPPISALALKNRTATHGEILISPRPQIEVSSLLHLRETSWLYRLLFSRSRNPQNELAVAEALKLLGVSLSISHQISPGFASTNVPRR